MPFVRPASNAASLLSYLSGVRFLWRFQVEIAGLVADPSRTLTKSRYLQPLAAGPQLRKLSNAISALKILGDCHA
jgi:hypothetical protein